MVEEKRGEVVREEDRQTKIISGHLKTRKPITAIYSH